MPIYGKTLTPPPWVLEKNLTKQKMLMLRRIFDKAIKDDQHGMAQTIKPNDKEYEKPYLYTFDAGLYPGTPQNYSYNLEAIINRANGYIKKDKIFGKDYRFDIMGNWSFGNIIIMKRSDMLAGDYEKQVKKYQKQANKKIDNLRRAMRS